MRVSEEYGCDFFSDFIEVFWLFLQDFPVQIDAVDSRCDFFRAGGVFVGMSSVFGESVEARRKSCYKKSKNAEKNVTLLRKKYIMACAITFVV